MSGLTLEFIIRSLTSQPLEGSRQVESVVIDSREARPGVVFAALRGEHADGHDYVADALQRGAIAAIVDRELDLPYPLIDVRDEATWRAMPLPRPPLILHTNNVLLALQRVGRNWTHQWLDLPGRRIIGITGSAGKTTTKELTAQVLSTRYSTLRSANGCTSELGVPLSVQRRRGRHERAVPELGMSDPGEIGPPPEFAPPQVGVVTLIAPVHAERAGSI